MRKSVFGGDGIATYVTVMMLVVSVLLNVLLAGRAAKTGQTEVVRADTVVVRDTVRVVEDRVVKEEVVRYDTVFFPVVESELKSEPKGELKNIPIFNELDSISNLTQDSAKVVIPITERTYEDSTYKAVVRGYNPELVSLEVYRRIVYIDRIEAIGKRPRVVVTAGVYGGFGVKGADYGLGISVGVPIWSW